MDDVAVDISRCFTAGHAYVALSRVRASADIIFLKDFEEYVVNYDTSSLDAYKTMRSELVSEEKVVVSTELVQVSAEPVKKEEQ